MPTSASFVACFIRHQSEILVVRQSNDNLKFPGKWNAVSGYVEESEPLQTATELITEITGVMDFELVRAGKAFQFSEEQGEIIPVLFEVATTDIVSNDGIIESEWVSPTSILDMDTVPGLWAAYERVGPSPETIRADTEHGSVYLSLRALESLRDTAAITRKNGGDRTDFIPFAKSLVNARPSMAAIQNRINRVMSQTTTLKDIEATAIRRIDRAMNADSTAAMNAVSVLTDKKILTLSRSGTIISALQKAKPEVVIAESRPDCEGTTVAEQLSDKGLEVTLCTDAALSQILATQAVNSVVVGVDSILPDGSIVNKTGTRSAALAATNESIPFYVIGAIDKVSPDPSPHFESGSPSAVYDGTAPIDVLNPLFDHTPAEYVDLIITEEGQLSPDEISVFARELESMTAWQKSGEA